MVHVYVHIIYIPKMERFFSIQFPEAKVIIDKSLQLGPRNIRKKKRRIKICKPSENCPGGEREANMDVSENSGTPKSSILIGLSIINHPF